MVNIRLNSYICLFDKTQVLILPNTHDGRGSKHFPSRGLEQWPEFAEWPRYLVIWDPDLGCPDTEA